MTDTPAHWQAKIDTLNTRLAEAEQGLEQANAAKAPVRKVGRPRKHKPGDVVLSKAEAALSEMAVKRARRDGTSFEIAFVKTIDSEEGAPLYRQIREARA